MRIAAYQYGIFPRSEDVVAATRGLERGRTSEDDVAKAFAADRDRFVELQRDAGLDLFSDGLLRWQDIFRPLVDAANGLDARTLVRWFDNNSFFRAPEVTGDLGLASPVPAYADDGAVPLPRVATLPSPFLFSRAAQHSGDRGALMMDLTREVLAPVVRELTGRGYDVVHLQEPWLPYFGIADDEWDDLAKALTELHDAVTGDARLVLHTYFGDSGPYVDRLRRLPVDGLGVDLVDTDPASLGSGWPIGILLGCLDGRRSPLEPLEQTAAFARRVAEQTGAPEVFLSSSCELELLPVDIAAAKVRRLGEVSSRLKEELP